MKVPDDVRSEGGISFSQPIERMATMNFEDLSDELKEKIKSCETIEELKKLAQLEDIELSADELDDIAGGRCGEYICPMKIWDKPRIIDE